MLKKTLQAVLESGNDYLVAVKANQPKLLAHLQTFSRHLKPKDINHSEVIQRGRVEQRTVHVFQASDLDRLGWPAVRLFFGLNAQDYAMGRPIAMTAITLARSKLQQNNGNR